MNKTVYVSWGASIACTFLGMAALVSTIRPSDILLVGLITGLFGLGTQLTEE